MKRPARRTGSSRPTTPHLVRAFATLSGAAFGMLPAMAVSVEVIQSDWAFRYADLDGKQHAVRLGRMEVYDQQPDGSDNYRAIGPFGTSGPFPLIVTSLDGKASARLENFETGGIDPAGRILAASAGGSVSVSMNFKRDDNTAGANYFATSPVVANVGGSFSALPYTVPGINTNEGRAFASFDAMVTGKRYLEFLGSQAMTINGVLGTPGITSVNQPASQDARTFQLNVGLNNTATRPGNISSDAFDWDILLHEVGHAASFANGFNSYPMPGGPHSFSETLTDKLAWSEGFSNFFQGAAQDWENRQTGLERLPDVRIAAGKESIRDRVTLYQDTIDSVISWDIEKKGTLTEGATGVVEATTDGELNELSIARMLWDLMDGTGGSEGGVDGVTLGHKTMFDLLVKSGAKTFLEFVDFLAKEFKDARTRADFGAIFAEHHVAPRALGALRAPPSPLAPTDPAVSKPSDDISTPGAIDAAAQTPAKDISDAPWHPDPLTDPSVPVFRVGVDPAPVLSWRAPWGNDDAALERYRLQLFKVSTSLPSPGPGDGDYTGDSDWTARPNLDLVRTIDLSPAGGGSAGGQFDNCGQVDELGYRCLQLDTGLIDALLDLDSHSRQIYWNVVGASDGADLDDGVWGNVATFEIYRVPEPGSLALLGLAMGCAWLHQCRSARRFRGRAATVSIMHNRAFVASRRSRKPMSE